MAERDATARKLPRDSSGRQVAQLRLLQRDAVARGPEQIQAQLEPAILHVRISDFAAMEAMRERPALQGQAVIVAQDTVLAVSPAARADGVTPGVTLRAAEKLCPQAVVLPPDPVALARAAREVLDILEEYTPLVEPGWLIRSTKGRAKRRESDVRLAGCFSATLDVRGCERLFGPATAIAEQIASGIAERGYTARVGIAANPSLAAVASARAARDTAPSQPVLVPLGDERAFLDGLPLTLFEDLDDDLVEHLRTLGVRQAGQLARLPAQAVRRRFGTAGQAAHEQASGNACRPVVAPPAPPTVEVRCHLDDPVVNALHLERELERLAARMTKELAARAQAASQITVTLTTLPPNEANPVDLSRRLHLKQPVSGIPAILARAREIVTELAPAAPITALHLELAALGPAATQLSFPILTGTEQHERLDSVACRLKRRFGSQAARRARLVADAVLPEERVVWENPGSTRAAHCSALAVEVDVAGLPTAVRRANKSWEPIRTICKQWRLRTLWWAAGADRHYYLVETVHGAVLEIYQEQSDGRWRLGSKRD